MTFVKGDPDCGRSSEGVKKKRRPRSELRKVVNKFNEKLDKAFDVVVDSLEGRSPDKDRLATAKWWIEKLAADTNSAIAEEQKKVQIRKSLDEPEEVTEADIEDEKPRGAVFQLVMPKKD